MYSLLSQGEKIMSTSEKSKKSNVFNYILLAILAVLAILVITGQGFGPSESGASKKEAALISNDLKGKKFVLLFHSESCGFCHRARKFIDGTLKSEFPDVVFKEYDVAEPEAAALMQAWGKKLKLQIGPVPLAVFSNDQYIFGFGAPENTGEEYRRIIKLL